jgi:hypothetical protein
MAPPASKRKKAAGNEAAKRAKQQQDNIARQTEQDSVRELEAVGTNNVVSAEGNVFLPPQLTTFSIKSGNPIHRPPLGEVVINPNTSSVVSSEYTSSELYETLRKKGRMGSESAMLLKDLVLYVRRDLFPKLKFIMHSKQLAFSTAPDTICFKICSDLGLAEMRASAWWELHKNKLVKTLNSKRADVTSAIKRIFVGKFCLCL